jgi:hypothetical protein
MLKHADSAILANHNFEYVKTPMRNAPDLPNPCISRPPQGSFLSSVNRSIPLPSKVRRPRLHFHKNQYDSIEHNQVQIILPTPPITRQDSTALLAIIPLSQSLPSRPEIERLPPPSPKPFYQPPKHAPPKST